MAESEFWKSCPKKNSNFLHAIIDWPSASGFIAIHAGGATQYAQEDAWGGKKAQIISKGKPFAGSSQGGGEHKQIYGTWEYGSGYPDSFWRGVNGRGFPFYFWPVIWDGSAVGNGDAYLYAASEYGPLSNNERPGDPLTTATFISSTTGNTYLILTDNATATSLISLVGASCSSFLNLSSIVPIAYPSPVFKLSPVQAIQYYRASSIVLILDGYNNTPILSFPDTSSPSLPGDSISDPVLSCINKTIGCSALLVDKDGPMNDNLGFLRSMITCILIVILLAFTISFLSNCSVKLLNYLREQFRRRRNLEGTDGAALLPQTIDHIASPAIAMSQVHNLSAVSTPQGADLGVNGDHAAVHAGVRRDEDAQSRHSSDTVTQVGEDDEIVLEELRW